MKKLTRKLLLSIIAVLFAFATLGTSTFAWFSTNTKVTASSMSVTAASPEPYLQIKLTSADPATYADLVNHAVSAEALKLVTVSAISGATVTWGKAKSTNPNEVQETNALTTLTAAQYQEMSTGENPQLQDVEGVFKGTFTSGQDTVDYGKIFIKQEYTLKNTSTVAAEDLTVAVRVSGGNSADLDSALRVLVVTSDAFAAFNGSGVAYAASTNEFGYHTTGENAAYAFADSDAVLADELAADGTLNVVVYVYFDGTDTNAKNTSSISTTALRVDLCFTINSETPTFPELN